MASERVLELMRAGAQRVLDAEGLEELLGAVDAATLSDQDAALLSDPALVEALRRSNHANVVRWATSVQRDPAAPVDATPSAEAITSTRNLVRRGLDDAALQAFRTGQNSAWQLWMQIVFDLTDDPDEVRELLTYSARSIFTFTDATIAALAAQMRHERDLLTRGTHAQRLETVTMLIDGASIDTSLATTRLGYDLDRSHVAAILWTDDIEADPAVLDAATDALAQGARALSVTASSTATWIWIPVETPPEPSVAERVLREHPTLRIGIGPAAPGPAGFRSSHLDALEVQRLLMRTAGLTRAATWDAVQLAALLRVDELRADRFVRTTLGDLADAAPQLRETVRIYLREQSNAARAARVLHTHRNTVLARLSRAEKLLPAPLSTKSLDVAAALEVDHWSA